ncbi:hypothetical protein BDV19DRAFT_367368 [Aspergillus venezuelensis]
MTNPSTTKDTSIPPPPPPPSQNPTSTLPPSVKNLKSNPDTFFRRPPLSELSNIHAPTGPYFLYGTLSEPILASRRPES